MFSINGIALDNAPLGWVLRAPTSVLFEMSWERPSLRIPGTDGVVAGLPADRDPVVLPFVVQTPRLSLESLLALVGGNGVVTRTSTPTRQAAYETISVSHVGYGPAEAIVDVTFRLRFSEPAWRDMTAVENTYPVTAAIHDNLSVLAGLSAPVGDALIRFVGPFTYANVESTSLAGRSFATLTRTVPAGQCVVFDTATSVWVQNAFPTQWSLVGTDVTGDSFLGGPRDRFEIGPSFTDPTARAGRVRVNVNGYGAGTSFGVRGRRAYLDV